MVVTLGPKTLTLGYGSQPQPRTPVKGVVQGSRGADSPSEALWRGLQMDVSTPLTSPAMSAPNFKETEEADLMYIPDDDQDWMKPKRPPSADSPGPSAVMNSPIFKTDADTSEATKSSYTKEEEEWLERKRLSGVIGRMVHYAKGDVPSKDILSLSRTSNGRIMVTCIRPDGQAARAGVVAGDQLVSINGEQIWEYTPAKAVLSGVRGPASLVFLGFSGKLQAEVRIKQPDEPRLGLSERISVSTKVLAKTKRDDARKQKWMEVQTEEDMLPPSLSVADTVVFTPMASPPAEEKMPVETRIGCFSLQAVISEKRTSQSLLIETAAEEKSAPTNGLYELLREDARHILLGALRPPKAEDSSASASASQLDTFV